MSFDKKMIDLIRETIPEKIAQDLVDIMPISKETGEAMWGENGLYGILKKNPGSYLTFVGVRDANTDIT